MPLAEAVAGRERFTEGGVSGDLPMLKTLPARSAHEHGLRPPTKPNGEEAFASASELAQLAPNQHEGKSQVLLTLARVLQRDLVRAERELSSLSAGTSGRDSSERLSRVTPFHGLKVPPIAVDEYILRIAKHAKCSPVCFVMAYAYLERLAKKDKKLRPCHRSVHRLLITGVMIAAKLTDDNYYNNAFYARIGGVSLAELNALELKMLGLLDFRLSVSRHQVLLLMKSMQLSLGSKTLVDGSRRSKKRVSEDAENELPDELPPSKCQHESSSAALAEQGNKPQLCQIEVPKQGTIRA
jgi:hypothetical protein